MLVWMTLAAGIAVCLLGSLAVVRVDRHWRRRHLRCTRCRGTWYGAQKFCPGCGAEGEHDDRRAEAARGGPARDRRGHVGTGPVPVVPGADAAPPRPVVDYGDRVWAAPVAAPAPRPTAAPAPAPARAPADEVAGRR